MPSLDGLRGIAIALVLCHNLQMLDGPDLQGLNYWVQWGLNLGWVGVTLFFALSGFLITGILLDRGDEPGGMGRFLARRALRIFPLYYGLLVLVFWVLPALGLQPRQYNIPWTDQLWFWTYLSNWAPVTWDNPLPHLWSLGVEEQFYLIWPLLIWSIRRPSVVWRVCVGVALASSASRLLLLYLEVDPEVPYHWTICRMDALALGAAAAAIWRDPVAAQWAERHWRRICVGTVGAFIATGVITRGWPRTGMMDLTLGYTVLAWTFACCVYATARMDARAGSHPSVPRPWLQHPWLMRLGLYSYGIYIWHKPLHDWVSRPLLARLNWQPSGHIGYTIAHLLVLSGLTVAVAMLSYHLYEKPFLKLKDRWN